MKCPHCARDFEPIADQRFCPLCGGTLDSVPRESFDQTRHEPFGQGQSMQPAPTRIEYCPWEDQENLGFMQGLTGTVKESMLSPMAFFERMPVRGGFLLPLLFAVIVESIGSMAAYLWSSNLLTEFTGSSKVLLALLIPLLVFMGLFLWGAVLHVSLFLVGGARKDFEATFRVVCYTSGPELLGIIPVVGGIASLVWKVYISVIGLREAHGISNGRAIAALALPGILCCGLAVVGAVSFSLLLGLS